MDNDIKINASDLPEAKELVEMYAMRGVDTMLAQSRAKGGPDPTLDDLLAAGYRAGLMLACLRIVELEAESLEDGEDKP